MYLTNMANTCYTPDIVQRCNNVRGALKEGYSIGGNYEEKKVDFMYCDVRSGSTIGWMRSISHEFR